jgi:hypothetical protein
VRSKHLDKEIEMTTSNLAANSYDVEIPSGLGRRIVSLIPGLLLPAAVGYGGKFIEQSIAVYTKAHHVIFPNKELGKQGCGPSLSGPSARCSSPYSRWVLFMERIDICTCDGTRP